MSYNDFFFSVLVLKNYFNTINIAIPILTVLSSFTSLLSLGRYYYQCLQGPLSFNETAGDKTCKRYFSIPAVPCSLREASVESSQVQCYLPAFMASRKNHLLFLRISLKLKKWSFVIKPTELDI